MKTAISIPDPIFQAAETLAHRLEMSRSQLYAEAVAEYIKFHKNQDVTKVLDRVYAVEDNSVEKGLQSMQMHSIPKEEW